MCVKIIGIEKEQEFNPSESLELQLVGAKEVLVDYDPSDSRIDCFVDQMEKMVENGISCTAEIKVDPGNYLDGCRIRTKLKKLKFQLDINEAVKKLTLLHAETDKRVLEIAEQCLIGKKINE